VGKVTEAIDSVAEANAVCRVLEIAILNIGYSQQNLTYIKYIQLRTTLNLHTACMRPNIN
jgi:hypothetical protein